MTEDLAKHLRLETRLRAVLKDLVHHGDITPAGKIIIERILDGAT
ncbi:hypothetical protein [Williamsia soli]|nr:hypothetical protein [Williamsia soli]